MIRCLLLLVTRNRNGEPVHDDRAVTGETLRIGRGTDCAIHLPDPRVMFLHATIRSFRNGSFSLVGNGKVIKSGRGFQEEVELLPGGRVLLGPYQLTVEPGRSGFDLVLAVELVQPLPDERHALIARSRTALAKTSLSMRWLSLALAVPILLAFLALPSLYAALPQAREAGAKLAVAPDESWTPGPLSDGHRSFGGDCSQCHQQPFVRVQDQACIACHKGVGAHIADRAVQARAFGQTRCAQCHLEHRGKDVVAGGHAGLCVDCHGRATGVARAAGLPVIGDFQDAHPPFSPTVRVGGDGWRRLAPSGAPLREVSGLKFAHKLHLAPAGVDSPGGRVALNCASCHVADEAGVRFEPVSMARHCEGCHRLEFEPAVTRRTVPHGSERQAMTVLREFYAGISIGRTAIDVTTVDGLLRRPGAPGDVAQRQAGAWAEAKAMTVARDLFEMRSCSTCHTVSRRSADADVPWKIAPVRLNRHWLPKARFAHGQHGDVACDTCHSAARSEASADVDIPGIATCRKCHGGARPARGKIASTCSSCHGFHADAGIASAQIASGTSAASGKAPAHHRSQP